MKFVAKRLLGAALLLSISYMIIFVARRLNFQKIIRTEIVINTPASRVWQVLIDFEAYPDWNPFIRQLTGIVSIGQQLEVKMHTGNHTMTFRPAVLAVKPDRELRWIGHLFIPGIFDGEHTFIIEPLGGNKVRMIQQEIFKGFIVPFSGSVFQDTEHSFNEMNQALKERAEQTAIIR